MKNTFFKVVVSCVSISALSAAPAIASNGANTTALVCDMERLLDKARFNFPVVINEAERIVTINNTKFSDSKFTSYEVKGEAVFPYKGVIGLSRSVTFALDRIAGNIIYTVLPKLDKGTEFSETQKRQLASLPMDPSFIGKCIVNKPMF